MERPENFIRCDTKFKLMMNLQLSFDCQHRQVVPLAMEWLEAMSRNNPAHLSADEEMADEEDFYGNGGNGTNNSSATLNHASPGAAQDSTTTVGFESSGQR